MLKKVLLLLVLCWPLLAQNEQVDHCAAIGPQDWEVVFNQETSQEMIGQNLAPVVDYESMIRAAEQQSHMSEERRRKVVFALKVIAENYPHHNWQPFRVFKVGTHRNPDCKLVALEAIPFEPPTTAPNPLQEQVAAKVAEAIPQVIGAEYRRQQESLVAQQAAAPVQQASSSRPSAFSKVAQIGLGGIGFFVDPYVGAIGVARPAIEMIAGWIAPGDDPTVRTLSAKGISPGPNSSVRLKKDWYKNPDW